MADDKARHPKVKDRVATEGLMWLLRGLKFTALGLRHNITNKEEELSVSFTKAYEGSLRKYHSIMIRPVFSVSVLRKCWWDGPRKAQRGGRGGLACHCP